MSARICMFITSPTCHLRCEPVMGSIIPGVEVVAVAVWPSGTSHPTGKAAQKSHHRAPQMGGCQQFTPVEQMFRLGRNCGSSVERRDITGGQNEPVRTVSEPLFNPGVHDRVLGDCVASP